MNMKTMGEFRDEKDVLDFVNDEKNNIQFIRFIFPDILGRMMDFTIPNYELESAFGDGKGFDGSSIEGFVRIEESDLRIVPDAKTFKVLPWEYTGYSDNIKWKEAVIFGDIFTPEGKHFQGDSRHILKKTLENGSKELRIESMCVGPELEFFIFSDDKNPTPVDKGGYFYSGKHGEIRKEVQLLLKYMNIFSEYDHHEVAPSQHEIDLRYKPALEMADDVMLFKYLIKRNASKAGFYATFMPKPITKENGSGMHVHQSLWKDGKNLFFDPKDNYNLSEIAKQYVTGLMKYGPEVTLVLNQWINSFKRLIPHFEAPTYLAWGRKNRSAYIRIPEYAPGKEGATRIELRSPDPSCNIYLAFTVMFNAGAQGIKEKLKLCPPVEQDIFSMSDEEQKELDIKSLPANLEEAVKLAKNSELLKSALGDHIFNKLIMNKEYEIKLYKENVGNKFDTDVSPYEIERYLPVL